MDGSRSIPTPEVKRKEINNLNRPVIRTETLIKEPSKTKQTQYQIDSQQNPTTFSKDLQSIVLKLVYF